MRTFIITAALLTFMSTAPAKDFNDDWFLFEPPLRHEPGLPKSDRLDIEAPTQYDPFGWSKGETEGTHTTIYRYRPAPIPFIWLNEGL